MNRVHGTYEGELHHAAAGGAVQLALDRLRVGLGAVLAVALHGWAKRLAGRRRGIADGRALRAAIGEHAPGGLVTGERPAVLGHPTAVPGVGRPRVWAAVG